MFVKMQMDQLNKFEFFILALELMWSMRKPKRNCFMVSFNLNLSFCRKNDDCWGEKDFSMEIRFYKRSWSFSSHTDNFDIHFGFVTFRINGKKFFSVPFLLCLSFEFFLVENLLTFLVIRCWCVTKFIGNILISKISRFMENFS